MLYILRWFTRAWYVFPFYSKIKFICNILLPPQKNKKGLYISYMQHLINNKILYATITDFQFMNSQLIF